MTRANQDYEDQRQHDQRGPPAFSSRVYHREEGEDDEEGVHVEDYASFRSNSETNHQLSKTFVVVVCIYMLRRSTVFPIQVCLTLSSSRLRMSAWLIDFPPLRSVSPFRGPRSVHRFRSSKTLLTSARREE